jgi:hypothetical protein
LDASVTVLPSWSVSIIDDAVVVSVGDVQEIRRLENRMAARKITTSLLRVIFILSPSGSQKINPSHPIEGFIRLNKKSYHSPRSAVGFSGAGVLAYDSSREKSITAARPRRIITDLLSS